MSRRRVGKIKVQHSLLEGLEKELREIEKWDCVESIIPGEIKSIRKGSGSKGLFLKYKTPSGFKLIWKAGTSFQEIFVVVKEGRFDEFQKKFEEYKKEK